MCNTVKEAFKSVHGCEWHETLDVYIKWLEDNSKILDSSDFMLTPESLMSAALRKLGFSIYEIRAKGRKREIVNMRRLIAVLLYEKFKPHGITLEKIGEMINRDHADVLHLKKDKHLIDGDYLKVYNELSKLPV